MTAKYPFEEQDATKPVFVQAMNDGPLSDNIKTFMNQAGLNIGVCFWQWESETEAVNFYTPESMPEDHQYKSLANELRSHLASFCERTEQNEDGVSRTEISVTSFELNKWFDICMLAFRSSDGKLERAVGTAQDITRWKTLQLELENKLDFINTLLDALISPVFYKDSNLVYRHCNKAFEKYLGKSREEILNKTVYDLSPTDLAEVYSKADHALMEGRKSQIYETKVKAADGNEHNVIFNKSLVLNRDGEITGMIGIINDITERVRMETRLHRIMGIKDAIVDINRAVMEVGTAEELYKIVLNAIVSAMPFAEEGSILKFDSEGKVKLVTSTGLLKSMENHAAVDAEDCVAWNAMDGNTENCFCVNDINKFSIERNITFHDIFSSASIRSMLGAPILSEGHLVAFITVGSRNPDAYDETDLFIMEYIRTQIMQVLNMQALYEKNLKLSRCDSLTGLFNRRHFAELFEMAAKHAHRYNESFHLVSIDLDHFKNINDSYGHQTGDTVLIDFAHKLKQSVRESDIVARYGGDEFILVIFSIDARELTAKLESMRVKLMEMPLEMHGISLSYSFSYGISKYPIEGTELDQLSRIADSNMYIYKKVGGTPTE